MPLAPRRLHRQQANIHYSRCFKASSQERALGYCAPRQQQPSGARQQVQGSSCWHPKLCKLCKPAADCAVRHKMQCCHQPGRRVHRLHCTVMSRCMLATSILHLISSACAMPCFDLQAIPMLCPLACWWMLHTPAASAMIADLYISCCQQLEHNMAGISRMMHCMQAVC